MPRGLKAGKSIFECSCGYQWLLYASALCIVYRKNPNKRRYETVILEVGRKNFKTFTIATIFVLLFLLESKFSKFYSVAPDGSLSREVKTAIEEILKSSPLVYQNKNHYRFKILRDYIEFLPNENKYIPLNYSNSRMDGKLLNVFLADEVGALPNSYAIEAMRSGQLNILNKLGCIVSTKYPTANNPFEDEVNYAKRVLDTAKLEKRALSEEERCAVLTEVITSSIGGMNEALGQTDAGKMAQLSAALENTQVRIGEIANEIKLSFAPMLSEIGNKAYDVGDSFGKLVESIISGDDDLSEEISNFKETVKILITEISNQIPAFLELGGQIISAIGEGLWAAIEPFAAQIAGWGLIIVGAIIALGPPISAAISAVMAVVGTAIAAWPVALGIALAGLIVAFWPQISKFFSDLWDGIASWCSDIWSKIKDFLSEHWQDVLLWIVSWPIALIKTLSDFWPQISAWLSGLWDNIMSAMQPMFDYVLTQRTTALRSSKTARYAREIKT